MTEGLFVVLVLALVVSNVFWIAFLKWILTTHTTERWQMQERIREPNREHVPVGDLVKRATAKTVDNGKVDEKDQKPVDEYELVGKIDPPTPLREDA